jgi:HK97 family phage portal protein
VLEASQQRKNILALPTGHELKSIGIDPEKSQMEKARRFQVEEAARIYQLPPSFLQDLTHGTFTNVEQQDLHFEKHSMHRWVKQVEQELNLKLFGRNNRDRFAEFNMDGLLRGDYKTRMEGYAIAIQNALNKPNEIRGIENWPDDPKGNDLLIQGATVPLGMQMTMNIKPPPKAKT